MIQQFKGPLHFGSKIAYIIVQPFVSWLHSNGVVRSEPQDITIQCERFCAQKEQHIKIKT